MDKEKLEAVAKEICDVIMETYDYLNGIEIDEENADEVIRQNGLLSFFVLTSVFR